jgi:hypothetical protein
MLYDPTDFQARRVEVFDAETEALINLLADNPTRPLDECEKAAKAYAQARAYRNPTHPRLVDVAA